MDGVFSLLLFAALVYVMMRFGCGAHMMGDHGGHGRYQAKGDARHTRHAAERKHHAVHSPAVTLRGASFARARRGAPRTDAIPQRGRVAAISTMDGFGFIDTNEHRLYFDRGSVLDDAFDELTLGAAVAFVEQQGEKGPQAIGVRMLGGRQYLAS